MNRTQRNLHLTIAYDGTHFMGWQKTREGRSVEQVLEELLCQIMQEPISLQATSRTDRGVHADQQVVNFHTAKQAPSVERLHESLICLLPDDLCVTECTEASAEFHPTLDCTGKEYRYTVGCGRWQAPKERLYSWHRPCEVDVNAMRQAAELLVGIHDFTAFCNKHPDHSPKNHVRTIHEITITELPNRTFCFAICGNAFLYRMVRNIVGTLLWVGRSKLSKEDVGRALRDKDRTRIGVTAPAHGLTLYRVHYS